MFNHANVTIENVIKHIIDYYTAHLIKKEVFNFSIKIIFVILSYVITNFK